MEWIFDNLQIIIVVAGAIAYWLNQRAREKAGQEADYDQDGIPENRPLRREIEPRTLDGGASEQEERARRIREEIQRKIAERRGQAAPPPMPAPVFEEREVVFREETSFPPPLRPVEVPPPMPTREVVTAYVDTEALERQRRLAEQLEQLEAQRREARRAAVQVRAEGRTPGATPTATAAGRGAALGVRGVGAELRDPRALRRAIVLREVLGAPVALR
jgi:hypothetical protein